VPFDAAELAAGCALSEGFQGLHYHPGVPTTIRAVFAVARRRKWTEGMPTATADGMQSLKKKLLLVPPLLAEWQRCPSLAAAQLLCAQARQLFEGIPLTRRFLRARSLAFQHEAAANTTGLPVTLVETTLQAIHAAETLIRESSHRLVVSHMYMVHLIGQEYRQLGVPEDDLRDLMQDGCLGLLSAAELFDIRAGARFRTYATFWLRQAVTRSLRTRRIVVPPRSQQRAARQLTRKAQQLEQLFARKISTEELAAATGALPEEIASAFATQLLDVSLDAPFGDGLTLADLLVAPDHPLDEDDTSSEAESSQRARLRRGRGQR
jgi:RNA polymerase sigma factor (sigma-70 family)